MMNDKYKIKKSKQFYYKVIVRQEDNTIKNRTFQWYKEALDCYMHEGIKMYAIEKGGFNAVGYYVTPVALMFTK